MFALTVGLGIAHGLILLPVLLSILGPKPFSSAEEEEDGKVGETGVIADGEDDIEKEKNVIE